MSPAAPSSSSTSSEWATFYSSLGADYETAFSDDNGLLEFLPRALSHLPSKSTVLDAGCGTGKPVAATLALAGHTVIGIDISEEMLSLARKAVPEHMGRFERADARFWEKPSDVSLSGVFAVLSLFTMSREDIEGIISHWAQMLDQGGILCVCTVAAEDVFSEARGVTWDEDRKLCYRDAKFRFMGSDVYITLFSREGWKWLLEREGFEIAETFEHTFVPPKEADSEEEPHFFVVAKKK